MDGIPDHGVLFSLFSLRAGKSDRNHRQGITDATPPDTIVMILRHPCIFGLEAAGAHVVLTKI